MAGSRGPDRRFFDIWSIFYDAPLVQRLTYRPGQDTVLRSLRRLRPRRVLDVGCGTGKLASRILEELEVPVTGCDFSSGMLRHARARNARVSWARADAQCLPFADQSFGAVTCTEAFHWFPDQGAALQEFRRVLAPGGHALIALVNPSLQPLSDSLAFWSRLGGNPFSMPTRRRMRELVEKAGLRVESQRLVPRIPLILTFPSVLTVAVRPG